MWERGGSQSIVIHRVDAKGYRRLGSYLLSDTPNDPTQTVKVAGGPPSTVAVAIGTEVRFISFRENSMEEDAIFAHRGTMHFAYRITALQSCLASNCPMKLAVIHRLPGWSEMEHNFIGGGDLICIYHADLGHSSAPSESRNDDLADIGAENFRFHHFRADLRNRC